VKTRSKHSSTAAVIGALLGPGIPAGYMALTGHAPMWARVWYLTLLIIGLLVLVAKAAGNDS
jgi:hypothetical protein